ncbi:MAG: hypothetical protein WC408_03310 [Candidatus Micrarchaeia archaeon]
MISVHTPGQKAPFGHGDPAGYGKAPIAPGIQEEAYHEAYSKEARSKQSKPANGPIPEPRTTMTTAGCEVGPDVHPVMRTNTRYGYVMEYIDCWRQEKVAWALFFFWLAAAIFTFTVFPVGSLLMFALAGRFRMMSEGIRFGSLVFGVNRTIMTVD